MKVLLINPNRYKSPPVPPIGLEYIAGSLEQKGHRSVIADLTFSEDIYKDINDALKSFDPDVVGISVRNIDTVLYHTNEFFLEEIKNIIRFIKSRYKIKVIVGGSGVSINPESICKYLNPDCVIVGPSENTIHEVLMRLEQSGKIKEIYYGNYNPRITCYRRLEYIDYQKYFKNGGIAGFETHKGCSSSCVYCLEARTKVLYKNIEDVIGEISSFIKRGYNHFHLCNSEFNENLDYSIVFCSKLKSTGLKIQWAVYMKPWNINKRLMRLMKDTGVYLITLSVDTWRRKPDYWSDVKKFIMTAKSYDIKIAVDLLTGFPYENEDTVCRCLDFFRQAHPDSVGINTYIRLYKSLRLTNIIMKDKNLRGKIIGNTKDRTFIKPVFYNHINAEKLQHLIDGDNLFRIEGLEKGVNYSRTIA